MKSDLEAALHHAHLPAVVQVLYHLTGDDRWLADPYRPTRQRGLDEHNDGGFAADVATKIRAAAVDAVIQYRAGRPAAIPAPTGPLLGAMLSTFLAEPVPPEYWERAAEQMSFSPGPELASGAGTLRRRAAEFSVAVIGAGISGLLVAARLRKLGFQPCVFERSEGIGGVWRQNRYPGAGVDTPSLLYSYGDHHRRWTIAFAKRDELLDYLEDYARSHDLSSMIKLRSEVVHGRWDESEQRWELTIRRDGRNQIRRFNAVISAVGLFTEPFLPSIPGMSEFRGPIVHSARWPADLDVTGRRVAVIGTGASAMQIVPAVAHLVEHLAVYQRSPQWIVPVPHYFKPVAPESHWLCDHVPFYRAWCRARLDWTFNDKIHAALRIDPDWPHPERSVSAVNDRHREQLTKYLKTKLASRPDLIGKAVPSYPPYGKRLLLDNGWFDALLRPNVELITEAIVSISPTGVTTTHESHRDCDVIVLSTGFQTTRYLFPMDLRGRDGRSLRQEWGDDNASAYLGITVSGFPNFFMMYGPATNAGGGSYINLAESQVNYIGRLLTHLMEHDLGAVDTQREAQDRYNRRLDEANAEMVWSHPGMTTYVRNSKGRVTVNMPWRVVDYWTMTRQPNLDHFSFEPRPTAQLPRGEP